MACCEEVDGVVAGNLEFCLGLPFMLTGCWVPTLTMCVLKASFLGSLEYVLK